MGNGMGLDEFLKPPSSGRKYISGKWKDEGKLLVFLHTQPGSPKKSIAWKVYGHPFKFMGTYEKDGEEREALRFTKFVSPDPEEVHENQFFREHGKTGPLRVKPKLDPFLLLREWLRDEIEAGRMKDDEVIFEWTDPAKGGALIQWRSGHLARLTDRGGMWEATLDTKLEYLFLVVEAMNPDTGVQIVRAPKSLGEAMREEIAGQIESNGMDDGNPLVNPYCFKWTYDKKATPAKQYGALRFNRQELTEAIADAINSEDFPDPSRDTKPRPGTKAKIRAAFEDAAQIELPWELLFVDAWEDDANEHGIDEDEFTDGPDDDDEPAPKRTAAKKPKGRTRKRKPDVTTSAPETSDREETDAKPRRRKRKKKSKPAWWVPVDEREECEDCGLALHPAWPTCPNCGAEYDVDGKVVEPPTLEVLKKAGWPVPEDSKEEGGKLAPEDEADDDSCWSCGAELPDDDVSECPSCGVDLGDELPF